MRIRHMILILSRDMAWRCAPLLIVLLMVGGMGAFTAVMLYDQLIPIFYFDTAEMRNVLFVQGLMSENESTADGKKLKELLACRPEVEDVYLHTSYWCSVFDGQSEETVNGVVNCFSGGYLDSLRWPLRKKIDVSLRIPDVIGIWADHRMQARHMQGDVITFQIKNTENLPLDIKAQIIGFLPQSGISPDSVIFANAAMPQISGLFQIPAEWDPMILVCDLEEFVKKNIPAEKNAFLHSPLPIALRLKSGTEEAKVGALQEELFSDMQAAAYTMKQIKNYTVANWRETMKRSTNNVCVLLYVMLCGVAAIEISLMHRKKKEMFVLALLGASRSSVRMAWLCILLPFCCAAAIAGAYLTEYLSSPSTAFLHFSDEPWIRLLPAAAVGMITICVNFLSFRKERMNRWKEDAAE